MKKTNETNYSKILGLDDKLVINFHTLKFNDVKIENEFNYMLFKKNLFLKIFIHLIYISLIILRIITSKVKDNTYVRYTNIVILIFQVVLEFFYYYLKNIVLKKIIDMVISFFYCLLYALNNIFVNFLIISEYGLQMRCIYDLIVCSITEILCSLQYNFFLSILLFMINISICFAITFFTIDDNRRYMELIYAFSSLSTVIYFKRNISILIRENYIQNHKFKRYFSHCNDLIESMNGFQFSLNDKKILFLTKI